ncbi:Class V chitinase [Linum perenne]
MVGNLDWAHLVAYDYHLPTKENFTANHAALFGGNDSTDSGVKEWVRVGFPANKMGLGVPYHGYGWRLVDPRNNSLGAPASGPDTTISGDMGYKLVKATVQEYGYGAGVVYDLSSVDGYGGKWKKQEAEEAAAGARNPVPCPHYCASVHGGSLVHTKEESIEEPER